MKRYIHVVLFFWGVISLITSCDSDMTWDGEQYEKMIYLLSDPSTKIYNAEYHFDGSTEANTISILCSGSEPLDKDVVVTVREDTILFDRYNKLNFDIDESKFAKKLQKGMYTFTLDQVLFPAGFLDVQLPVKIDKEVISRISPDSVYLIPVAIDKVSEYDINPDNYNMLLRVYAYNDYASMLTRTAYRLRGKREDTSGTSGERDVTAEKVYEPISANEIRTFAGITVFERDEQKIRQNSMIVAVNEDNTVSLRAYSDAEDALVIEQLEMPEGLEDSIYNNTYDPSNRRFRLYYRYSIRTLKDDVYENSPWIVMKELTTRDVELN